MGAWPNYTRDGHLAHIDTSQAQFADFRYSVQGDLEWSRDTDKNEYEDKYDTHHNLTRIGYRIWRQ
jgi:hypothetical protein